MLKSVGGAQHPKWQDAEPAPAHGILSASVASSVEAHALSWLRTSLRYHSLVLTLPFSRIIHFPGSPSATHTSWHRLSVANPENNKSMYLPWDCVKNFRDLLMRASGLVQVFISFPYRMILKSPHLAQCQGHGRNQEFSNSVRSYWVLKLNLWCTVSGTAHMFSWIFWWIKTCIFMDLCLNFWNALFLFLAHLQEAMTMQ